jgi:hypothetical protein
MTSSIRDSAESAGGSEEYGTGADAPVPEDTVEGMRDPHTHPLAAPLGRLPNGARIVIPVVVGTRPEAIKLVPVILALQASEYYQPLVVSTGQHARMVSYIFDLVGIRRHPVVGGAALAAQRPRRIRDGTLRGLLRRALRRRSRRDAHR